MTHPLEEELRRLTADLQAALDDFRRDSRLVQMAEQDVPDAQHRLAHVLRLTDDAAHRTLDLVEQSVPLAERTAQTARLLQAAGPSERQGADVEDFLAGSAQDMERLRTNLTEMLLAQGYQDLSGQILRSVMKLVQELELTLARLLRISGEGKHSTAARKTDALAPSGPAVPGLAAGSAVGAQTDVDDLLTGLGL